MKTRVASLHKAKMLLLLIAIAGYSASSRAQCDNVLYSLSYTGVIYSVNPTTNAQTQISNAAPSTYIANAMGYNGSSNTFYFFADGRGGASNVFESFVPGATLATGVFTTLSNVGSPSGTVNSGCVNPGGTGYYCLDNNGYIYYYDFASNTWTTITTSIKDGSGVDITALIAANAGGDMAFDGVGNLWLVVSGKYKYGLYKIAGPVPTMTVASLTATQVLAPTAVLPDGKAAVGVAFNSSGQMYIASLDTSTIVSNIYLLATPSSTPTLVGSGPTVNNVFDLASCSTPISVLPVNFLTFTATTSADRNSVNLSWSASGEGGSQTYYIERSTDKVRWQVLDSVAAGSAAAVIESSFKDVHVAEGTQFYRICEKNVSGYMTYSKIIAVGTKAASRISLWPNPTQDVAVVLNNSSTVAEMELIDPTGRICLRRMLQPGINRIGVNTLHAGTYMALVRQTGGSVCTRLVKK